VLFKSEIVQNRGNRVKFDQNYQSLIMISGHKLPYVLEIVILTSTLIFLVRKFLKTRDFLIAHEILRRRKYKLL